MQNYTTQAEKIRLFSKKAGQLKFLKRTGWTRFPEIKEVESVADHSHRLALLTLLFQNNQNIDIGKCLKFATMHDLAEAIAGDITPYMNVSPEEKYHKELHGLEEIIQSLDQDYKKQLKDIWLEYEKRECLESKLVKDLDRYEMMLQAHEYEEKYNVNLEQFYNDIPKIKNEQIKEWAQHLKDNRQNILQKQDQK